MKTVTEEMVKELQSAIDAHRSNGVHIEVSVGVYDDERETGVSIKFSDQYDAMEVGNDLRSIIGECDSGAGFGYRDLQLCSFWPNLK